MGSVVLKRGGASVRARLAVALGGGRPSNRAFASGESGRGKGGATAKDEQGEGSATVYVVRTRASNAVVAKRSRVLQKAMDECRRAGESMANITRMVMRTPQNFYPWFRRVSGTKCGRFSIGSVAVK